MHQQPTITKKPNFENIPLIDGEFDSFELNNDLELQLRETDAANFYHDNFDMAE